MSLTTGKSIISLVAIATGVGPYLADWSETHVLNPNWPPHARFHNGQTMTTGLSLCLLSLYYLYRPLPETLSTAVQTRFRKHYLNLSLIFIHLYYIPALSGSLYPGALWVDPEFGEGRPQLYLFTGFLGIAWLGRWVEGRRLDNHIQVGKNA